MDVTITVSDAMVAKLQGILAHYNQRTGQNLTLKQWAWRMLADMAIREELLAHEQTVRATEEAARDAAIQAAVIAERDRLLATIR